MCYYVGFVVPFIEHKQNRFSIILKSPRIFRMVNEHEHELKVISSIIPNKRIRLSFEADY